MRQAFSQCIWLFVPLMIGVLGCGDEDSGPAPIAPGGAGIQGHFIDTYISEGGEEILPRDPSRILISALVPQPNQSYKKYPGTLKDDGSIEIPDVPEGVYFLRLQAPTSDTATFYKTQSRVLELGQLYASRSDVESIASAPTEMLFNATGLAPWQDKDTLELYSLGAGAFGLPFFDGLMVGDTALNNAVFDAMELLPPVLIDGSRGDLMYLSQLSTRVSGSLDYKSIAKVLKPQPFSVVDGGQVTVNGSFEDMPQSQVSIEWKRSLFGALAKDIHSSAVFSGSSLYFYSEVGGSQRVTSSIPPTLLDASGGADETTDFIGELGYGNPFPGTWASIGSASAGFSFDVNLPGAASPRPISGSILCSTLITGTGPIRFEPSMYPVQEILVNGKSTAAAVADVGLAPEISWAAPSVGAPKTYRVVVRKLDPMGASKTVATIFTPDTSVLMPDNVLQKGGFYYLRITGLINAVDLSTRDDVGEYGCFAEALTDVIEP